LSDRSETRRPEAAIAAQQQRRPSSPGEVGQ